MKNKYIMKGKVKVAFIHLAGFESKHALFRVPPLTFQCLAAVTPLDVEIVLIDESFEAIDFDIEVDIVGISVILPFSQKAYFVAECFKNKGVTVVLGGHHVTAMPDEAIKFADTIVIGEGDLVWPDLIYDYKRGALKSVYKSKELADLAFLPQPRKDLISLKTKYYSISNSVLATRGCPHACTYCSIKYTFPGFRKRPVKDVIEDIENSIGNFLQKKIFIFWDDNIVGDKEYAYELFGEMVHLHKYWISQATLADFASDKKMVQLASKSGCKGIFCGIESINQSSLQNVNKNINDVRKYKKYIEILHDNGISVDAGMMIGFDDDDKRIFEQTLETAIKLNIDIMNLVLVTPYPGTPLFKKLEKEQRLLHKDWSLYDAHHVVFKPKNMSPNELLEGWHWTRKEFYKLGLIGKRVLNSGAPSWITLPHNLSTRRYVKMESKNKLDYSTVQQEIRVLKNGKYEKKKEEFIKIKKSTFENI